MFFAIATPPARKNPSATIPPHTLLCNTKGPHRAFSALSPLPSCLQTLKTVLLESSDKNLATSHLLPSKRADHQTEVRVVEVLSTMGPGALGWVLTSAVSAKWVERRGAKQLKAQMLQATGRHSCFGKRHDASGTTGCTRRCSPPERPYLAQNTCRTRCDAAHLRLLKGTLLGVVTENAGLA